MCHQTTVLFSVPRKAYDPTGKNLYHKLCKEGGEITTCSYRILLIRKNCNKVYVYDFVCKGDFIE